MGWNTNYELVFDVDRKTFTEIWDNLEFDNHKTISSILCDKWNEHVSITYLRDFGNKPTCVICFYGYLIEEMIQILKETICDCNILYKPYK